MAEGDSLTREERRALRTVLQRRWAFLGDPALGPTSVAAGECDRCGHEPRLVQPCGPPPDDLPVRATPDWALGRRCAIAIGTDGWCDGHTEEAEEAIAWLRALPEEADQVARLWWVATGEVRPDHDLRARARALLPAGAA